MKFSELKIGTLFQFVGNKLVYIKSSKGAYQYGGRTEYCSVEKECIPRYLIPASEIKAFKDLIIGARFRFADGTKHLIKVAEEEYCSTQDVALISKCEPDKLCVSVFVSKILTFKSLNDGDKFTFKHGDSVVSTKVTDTTYLRQCTYIDAVVERDNDEV